MLASELDEIELDGAKRLTPKSDMDNAIIGIAKNSNGESVAVYGYYKVLEILMNRDRMDRCEAEDWISCNTERSLSDCENREPLLIFEVER